MKIIILLHTCILGAGLVAGLGWPSSGWNQQMASNVNADTRAWNWTADFYRYHNYTEIMDWLDTLVRNCGDPIEKFTVGQSHEGRNLTGVKIESASGPGRDSDSIWIDGGIHGNEWIGHVMAMYLAARICDGSDSDSTEMKKSWNFYILPVVNPDAYEYTWTTDRNWRTTRKPTFSGCIGSDPNRNWDFKWNTTGANMSNPCSRSFPGTAPFSEPETKAVSDFILSRRGKWVAYLNLHSAMEQWIPPWGYTSDRPADYADLERVCIKATEAAKNTHGKNYKCARTQGNSGTVKDWAKGGAGIKYSYTVELRAAENYTTRQILPPEEILPTGDETWAAIVAMANEIKAIGAASGCDGMTSVFYLYIVMTFATFCNIFVKV